jgi:hypothetical protein
VMALDPSAVWCRGRFFGSSLRIVDEGLSAHTGKHESAGTGVAKVVSLWC